MVLVSFVNGKCSLTATLVEADLSGGGWRRIRAVDLTPSAKDGSGQSGLRGDGVVRRRRREGRICLNNNAAERAFRGIVFGQKLGRLRTPTEEASGRQ